MIFNRILCPSCGRVYLVTPGRWMTCYSCQVTFRRREDGGIEQFKQLGWRRNRRRRVEVG